MKSRIKVYKLLLKWMFKDRHTLSVIERREKQKKFDNYIKLSRSVEYTKADLGNVPADLITPRLKHEKTVIYFHGGAYVLGGTKYHLNLCADIASGANAKVYMVDYRLAPEDPFPGALEDGLKSYRHCLENGINPNQIGFGGDSAGGGLVLSLLAEIRKAKLPMPACAFCFSPWTDLTLSGESHSEKSDQDPILKTSGLEEDAQLYAGTFKLKDPRISPLYCTMHDFPPIFLQVGADEILLDDAKRFYEKARSQSVPIKLEIWPDMVHVFQILPLLPEREQAITHTVSFLNQNIKIESID